jgi:hypothetical protein
MRKVSTFFEVPHLVLQLVIKHLMVREIEVNTEKAKPGDLIVVTAGVLKGLRYRVVDCPDEYSQLGFEHVWIMRDTNSVPSPMEDSAPGRLGTDSYDILERAGIAYPTKDTVDESLRRQLNDNLRSAFT